jgi:hypothetical protein
MNSWISPNPLQSLTSSAGIHTVVNSTRTRIAPGTTVAPGTHEWIPQEGRLIATIELTVEGGLLESDYRAPVCESALIELPYIRLLCWRLKGSTSQLGEVRQRWQRKEQSGRTCRTDRRADR